MALGRAQPCTRKMTCILYNRNVSVHTVIRQAPFDKLRTNELSVRSNPVVGLGRVLLTRPFRC